MLNGRTIILAMALLMAAPSAEGQEGEQRQQMQQRPELARLQEAFSTADDAALYGMLSDRVEVAIFGRSRLYSRSQARIVLRDLFSQYPPQQFELSAPSQTSKGLFAAGTYRYSADKEPFQVYVRLRKSGENWTLREILVDNADR